MNRRSERGAMLIMVAVSLLALTLFSAFVVDQGIMYAARRQAQTSADAAALAGAIARTYDDTTDPPLSKTSGVIWEAATKFAAQNPVWGIAPPSSSVTLDWTCPKGPAFGTTQCVVADVYRDGTHGSQRLDTIFLNMIGMTKQDARAHAVAWPAGSNIADCLRPWFVLNNNPLTGLPYDPATDIGSQIILDSEVTPSGFGKIDVGSGENDVVDAVHSCVDDGSKFAIGQNVGTQTGAAGNPTVKAVNEVIDWDLGAHYDPVTKTIQGSCAPSCDCTPYACPNASKGMSPRIFIAPLCDPINDPGCVSGGNGSTHNITITNFLSFFIESAQAHGNGIKIIATLIGGAGDFSASDPGSPAPFLRTILLIR